MRFGPLPPPIDTTFKITVDTTKAGSASNTFVLPLQSGATNMTVYWGDGNSDLITTYNQAELTHVYSVSGSYQISLDGSFRGIRFGNLGDKLKLSSIDNWGTNQWVTMASAFHGCSNLTANYTDNLDSSLVTDMTRCFMSCSSFNGALNIDTSSVTDFFFCFYVCSSFNQEINWNTSSVNSSQSFSNMFNGCTILNSSFSFSDTSLAKNFSSMFANCIAFNQPIDFNTSSATTIGGMFINCYAFNQSINFTATLCTNIQSMFQGCNAMNSSINLTTSSLLTNCSYFFLTGTVFNNSITISDTSGVTTMQSMFQQCSVFDQDISSFDISSLINATNMMLLSGFSATNYDLLLVSWQGQTHNNSVNLHAGTAKYNTGAPATARAGLITDSWTITDGGAV